MTAPSPPPGNSAPGLIVSLERGTCSDRATSYFCAEILGRNLKRAYAANFTEAAAMVINQSGAILLAPHLHAICGELSTSAGWASIDPYSFALDNPPLYLARRADAAADAAHYRCATIVALRPLIENDFRDETGGIPRLLDVATTQAAARMCAEGIVEYCVTNEAGLTALNLTPVRQLKQITVWWIAFRPITPGASHE